MVSSVTSKDLSTSCHGIWGLVRPCFGGSVASAPQAAAVSAFSWKSWGNMRMLLAKDLGSRQQAALTLEKPNPSSVSCWQRRRPAIRDQHPQVLEDLEKAVQAECINQSQLVLVPVMWQEPELSVNLSPRPIAGFQLIFPRQTRCSNSPCPSDTPGQGYLYTLQCYTLLGLLHGIQSVWSRVPRTRIVLH